MANSCGCDCELWTPEDGEPDVAFPLQCHCNMCGPVTAEAEGCRCQARLSLVAAFIANKDQGKPVPTNLEEMKSTIVFCGDCEEHHREQRMLLAIQRMRAKVADAKRKRREQKRKYLRALFRTRFHGVWHFLGDLPISGVVGLSLETICSASV